MVGGYKVFLSMDLMGLFDVVLLGDYRTHSLKKDTVKG
jgi:hypothetical protein